MNSKQRSSKTGNSQPNALSPRGAPVVHGEQESAHDGNNRELYQQHGHWYTNLAKIKHEWVMVALTLIYASITFGLLRVAIKSNEVNKTLVENAREEIHRSHRPWLAIVGPIKSGPLVFDNQGKVDVQFPYSIRNGGNSPALRAITQRSVFVGPLEFLIREAQRLPACDTKFVGALTQTVGSIILPGGVWESPSAAVRFAELSPQPLISGTKPFAKQPGTVCVRLCVGYRDEFDRLHATGQSWVFVPAKGGGEFVPVGVVDGHWEELTFGAAAN